MAIVERPTDLVSLTPDGRGQDPRADGRGPRGRELRPPRRDSGRRCSGFQYGLGFDAGPVDDDATIEQHGVTIVIDPYSAPYLKGATIDFLSGLEESGFKIDNPNAQASCGCGHSFTVEEGAELRPTTPRTLPVAAAPAARTS